MRRAAKVSVEKFFMGAALFAYMLMEVHATYRPIAYVLETINSFRNPSVDELVATGYAVVCCVAAIALILSPCV